MNDRHKKKKIIIHKNDHPTSHLPFKPGFKTLFLISHFLLPVIVHNTVDSYY